MHAFRIAPGKGEALTLALTRTLIPILTLTPIGQDKAPHLDGKHVVFGMVSNMEKAKPV